MCVYSESWARLLLRYGRVGASPCSCYLGIARPAEIGLFPQSFRTRNLRHTPRIRKLQKLSGDSDLLLLGKATMGTYGAMGEELLDAHGCLESIRATWEVHVSLLILPTAQVQDYV